MTNHICRAFMYTWKVVNFAYNPRNSLKSPYFTVEALANTKWYLELVRVCTGSGKTLVCYLRRDDGEPENINVCFNISSVNTIGSWLLYEENRSRGQTLVEDISKWDPPKENVNIVCIMWRHEEMVQTTHCRAASRVKIARWSNQWKITLEKDMVKTYSQIILKFPSRICGKEKLKLPRFNLTFNYKDTLNRPISIDRIVTGIKNDDIHMHGEISILDKFGKIYCSFKGDFLFNSLYWSWNHPTELPLSTLYDECLNHLQTNENLVLLCEFSASDGIVMSTVESPTISSKSLCEFDVSDGKVKSNVNSPLVSSQENSDSKITNHAITQTEGDYVQENGFCSGSVKKDLKILYIDKTFYDITLYANDQAFPAHKNILLDRCPLFYDEVCVKGLAGELTNKVDVDLDADTLHRFLTYIYFETLLDLEWKNAVSLFVVADRYDVSSLKRECSSYLKSHLSVRNMYETVVLGDMHQDNGLKSTAKDFICVNAKEIFPTDSWRSFMENEKSLSSEILYLFSMKQLKV